MAGDEAVRGRVGLVNGLHGEDEGGEIFFFFQAGEREDDESIGCEIELGAKNFGGSEIGERGVGDAVGDDGDFIFGDFVAGEHGVGDGVGDGEEMVRAAIHPFVGEVGKDGFWAGAVDVGGVDEMLG